MAQSPGWLRQLDSGLWAITIRTPVGRITESFELRSQARAWAVDQAASIGRGEWLDPRLGRKTLSECWDRFAASRRLEKASRRRDESHWRCWVAPKWGKAQVGAILRPDVNAWVNDLEDRGIGGWTIIAAVNVLRAALDLAVEAKWIRVNPCADVRLPVPPAHEDRVIDTDEEQLLLARLDELFPDRRDARLFVEFLLDTGARWEEGAAVRREAVDLRHRMVGLGPVMERDGTIREYPKGARDRAAAGFRDVPVGDDLWPRLRAATLATEPKGLVFTAPRGGHLLYPTWRSRVWVRALRVPVLDESGRAVRGPDGAPLWRPLMVDPLPTPHDCRHTYGTRMRDAGMEQHDVMALMGHKDQRSHARYVHSTGARFDRAREAKRKIKNTG